jgi:energy-coupling factor transporter transmembrane protein EcfT
MTVAQAPQTRKYDFLLTIKSFLIWTFALTVSWFVVGFPIVAIMATLGALAALVLQAVIPMSSVLVVSGMLLLLNVFGILFGAALLAVRGIHPHEVSWLKWLDPKNSNSKTPIFAACPLTCDRTA